MKELVRIIHKSIIVDTFVLSHDAGDESCGVLTMSRDVRLAYDPVALRGEEVAGTVSDSFHCLAGQAILLLV